jgi:ubiquinol-cytochrome c reductase cytochrome b subunit
VLAFLGWVHVGTGITAELIPEWFGNVDITTWENAVRSRDDADLLRLLRLPVGCTRIFGWEKTKPVPERVTTHD